MATFPSSSQSLMLQDLRVLVVDDEDDSSTLLVFALEQMGAETVVATTVGAALELMQQFRPDILLSDINLPDEDGYALIRQVRALPAAQGGQTPAIAVTGFSIAECYDRALSEGFQHYLTKPIDLDQMLMLVASLAKQNQVI